MKKSPSLPLESRTDPVSFVRTFLTDVNGKHADPHPGQEQILRNIQPLTVGCCGRQFGKSITYGWYGTWFGATHANKEIYVIAQPLTKRVLFSTRSQVNVQDTMTSVVDEVQYDAVNFPNQRPSTLGGYTNGVGNWTIQFYLPGPTALSYLMLCGLSDSGTIGTGNLHNHFVLGYNHTNQTNDVEIDGSITLSNL